ncbi:isochorismatase family protein [Streptomyces sp. gCLA4]|uniref:isochorismatase family protein n=1 Tax=Streptomyces sp. gCLA4 TaxID=1873416 RepID=UPI0016027B2B|nr:isochorismatase family protein [Streptomyces sp. gCLA4]
MLLIDHQTGTMSWTHSHDVEHVEKSALNLAKIATAVGMPLVLTSSQEDRRQGPLVPELEEIAPKAVAYRIKRTGIVNAMHDEGYEVQVVTDASASFTKIGDDAALRRMEQAGAVITSTAQITSELAVDWTSPRGQGLAALMGL